MEHLDDNYLLRYRFDTLDEEEAREAADHLKTCSRCSTQFAKLVRNLDKLDTYGVEDELQPDLVEQVLLKVKLRQQEQEVASAKEEAQQARQKADAMAALLHPTAHPSPGRGGMGSGGGSGNGGGGREGGERLSLWAWLGWSSGGSLRAVRLAASLLTLAGAGYIAGGFWYHAQQRASLDTQIRGEEHLLPGSRAVLQVRLRNTQTNKPVSRGQVQVSMKGREQTWKLYEGITDQRGEAMAAFSLPDVKDGDYRLEVISLAEGETDTVSHPIRFRRGYKVHLSTDKPLYQPGQTIHIRTLVLRRPRLLPPAGQQVTIEVQDPKGVRIARKELAVSSFGVSSWSLELADDVRLGAYKLKARVDGVVSEMKVKVARYALPKFKVSVKPQRSFYLAGETLRAGVEARYFFGKPLQGAAVRVVLFKPSGAVLGQEITGRIDQDGRYQFSAELPAHLSGRAKVDNVMVEVAVKDAAGQEERKQASIPVARELLQVDAMPEGGELVAGMDNTVYVLTTTPDDKPVACQARVKLPTGRAITVRTHQNGLGSFSFRAPAGVTMVALNFEAQDDEGQRGSRRVLLRPRKRKLLAATDRAFYRPGETIKVGIQARSQYTSALVEGIREGQTVLSGRVALKKGKGVAELDLPPELKGTVRLDITALDPYEVRSPVVSRRVVVAQASGLKIKMSTDQPSFRPGGKAKLRFEVTDPGGKPTPAAIGLSVVDESVFALAESRPALARAYFLLERSLMETRHNLSAPEALVAPGEWSEARQQAGRFLLSLGGDQKRPQRFTKRTHPAKVAGLQSARLRFEDQARALALALGLMVLFLMVVAAAGRLPSWAGGTLLALGTMGALLVSMKLIWVLGGLTLVAAVALMVHWQRARAFGWAFIVMPVLGITVMYVVGFSPTQHIRMMDRDHPSLASAPPTPQPFRPAPLSQEEREDEQMLSRFEIRGSVDVSQEVKMVGPTGDLMDSGGASVAAKPKAAPHRSRARAKRRIGILGSRTLKNFAEKKAPPPRRAVRVRRYFPETMYVHPELVTDEKGVAELTIPLADSITSWRVNALASSAGGKLGHMDRPLKVFQDFFVDLDLPAALVRGDEAAIPVAVYNYLTTPQTVRLEVKTQPWFQLTSPARVSLELPPSGLGGAELRLRVLRAGKHRLGLRADGTALSDALARELLVSEAGQERNDTVSGTLIPGQKVRVQVQVPDAAVRGTARLLVKLFPNRLSSALDGLAGALRMPHGCFEQTSSATYPNVLILDYLKRSNKLTPALKKRALRYISLGYQRLVGYEVRGGGFEWFGRSPANLQLSAYGLMEFVDMSRVFPVDQALIQRTQRWLVSQQRSDGSFRERRRHRRGFRSRRFRRPPRDSRRDLMVSAYVTWALAESGFQGQALPRALTYLSGKLNNLDDPYTLALISSALAKAGHASAPAAAAALQTKASSHGARTFFRPRQATIYQGRGRAGLVETTALAAHSLAQSGKYDPLVRGALEYLAASRDHRGTWYSTQGTILALRALLQATGAEQDQQVTVRINGKDAATVKLEASASQHQLVDLGPQARPGVNVVELSGQARAAFSVIASYTLPWQEKEDDETRPLSLAVSYGRTSVDLGGIIPLQVRLTYRKPEPSGMVLLALGLPAGFAPLTADLEALRRSRVIGRYEVRTGRINLYLDRLDTGTPLSFDLRLKARNKVRTKGAASLAYLYYSPEVRVSQPPTPVSVN